MIRTLLEALAHWLPRLVRWKRDRNARDEHESFPGDPHA